MMNNTQRATMATAEDSSVSRSTRRVRFSNHNQTILVLPSNDCPSTNNKSSVPSKLESRRRIQHEAVVMKEKGFGVLLRDTFYPCASSLSSTNNSKNKDEAQRFITALVQCGEGGGSYCCRGLELYLNGQHEEERFSSMENVRQAVLVGQKVCRSQNKTMDVTAKALATASIAHSQAAKAFARRLGIADELAAIAESSCDHCRILEAASLVRRVSGGNAHMARRRPSLTTSTGSASIMDPVMEEKDDDDDDSVGVVSVIHSSPEQCRCHTHRHHHRHHQNDHHPEQITPHSSVAKTA